MLGQAFQINASWRIYAEAAYAYHNDGGSRPWQFLFGAEYSPYAVTEGWGIFGARLLRPGLLSSPFLAAHGDLRQELNYSGAIIAQAGWQWRGLQDGRLLRFGAHFQSGPSSQYEFYYLYERQVGVALWYDF